MYAGNSRLIRANEDEDLAGTLFIGKKDLLEVGGYDERLQDYGGEQKDLLERLDKNRMRRLNIDYSTLLHNHYDGEAERGLTSRQVENLVEEAVNLELREKVPMWNSLEAWRSFSFIPESMLEPNASVPSRIHANVQYRDIVGRSQVPSIRDVLMDSAVDTTKGKVLSRMLHEWFDMPSDFTDLLDGSDKDRILYALLEKRQTASRFTTPRVLVMHCVGGLIPRLFALASGLAIANHTDRLPIVVWEKEAPLVTALFQELFEVQEHFMVAGIYTKQFFEKYTEDQKSGEEMRSMQVYDLAGQQEASSKLIHTSSGTHIFIRASKAVGADVVRYTSPMSIREQFQMLALEESVQSRLRDLADKGISERLGIYVGESEPYENSDITDLGTIMKEKVEAVRPGALPPAYIVSDLPTFERIRPVFGSIIHNLPLSMDCTAEDIDCSRTELVRLFALTKTREFISIQEAQEDDLSELVMLLRGHSTDW
ncbi:unnamed protein product [Chondrus crispus]|uniref:Galactosyltransferase C-terminal domain-containing protein n=1 Tax=Chondrus crispus TaxID=2769 RepID=S0F3U7_CHOCR|nr:unnamed protein product [Chondrus crispus]CDF77453.1 unnamed protein product [Chondrus crispus]|eukprot:XP_005712327.1 unnamed protein product [Chondrus crispus]